MTLRRLIAPLSALLPSLLCLLHPLAAVAASAIVSVAHADTYDSVAHLRVGRETATERGPLAVAYDYTAHRSAVDTSSHGSSAGAQPAPGSFGVAANTAEDWTRVGRWMSPEERAGMLETGNIQWNRAGTHRVGNPPTPDAYKAAPKGDVYVEYEVPTATLRPHSQGTSIIYGPNSLQARLPGRAQPGVTFPSAISGNRGSAMPNRNRFVLEVSAAWHGRNAATLALTGLEAVLIGPTSGSNKDSVTVEIVSLDELVAVTIWDSGEYEVITALVADDSDPVVEVGELRDETQVVSLLDRVVASIPRGRDV